MATAIEAPATTKAEGPTSHTQNQVADMLTALTDEQFMRLVSLIDAHRSQPLNGPGSGQGTYGYTRDEQIEALHKLREPFKPEEIRYLPRMWCGSCKNSQGKGCQQHPRKKCGKCGQNMPGGHIDLRFVGHAEATNRLLNVDPFWDWEPLTVDQRGLPQTDGYGGLWIRLTVCGVSRLGYGHADGKTGGDAIKETIGDAIRNAGMRFGMALNLWTSSDLEILESGVSPVEQDGQVSGGSSETAPDRAQRSRGGSQPEQGGERQETREEALARLTEQYRNCWGNALALTQIRIDGKQRGLSEERVQGPPPESAWTTFDALLEARITGLANQERGAA